MVSSYSVLYRVLLWNPFVSSVSTMLRFQLIALAKGVDLERLSCLERTRIDLLIASAELLEEALHFLCMNSGGYSLDVPVHTINLVPLKVTPWFLRTN